MFGSSGKNRDPVGVLREFYEKMLPQEQNP